MFHEDLIKVISMFSFTHAKWEMEASMMMMMMVCFRFQAINSPSSFINQNAPLFDHLPFLHAGYRGKFFVHVSVRQSSTPCPQLILGDSSHLRNVSASFFDTVEPHNSGSQGTIILFPLLMGFCYCQHINGKITYSLSSETASMVGGSLLLAGPV